MTPAVALVVPCFNEEAMLPATNGRLVELLKAMREAGEISPASVICYVDDGSTDATWKLISEFGKRHGEVCGIRLSRNFGHQAALMSGLLKVPGDAVITIDADLQDDVSVIPCMIADFKAGSGIVYGVRKARQTDSLFKRFTAAGYYRFLRFMKVDIVVDHADFRLVSRRFIQELSNYREVNLFLRGVVRLVGFRSSVVEYDRGPRLAGETRYPLSRMLALAWEGTTSFSTFPLRLITITGVCVSVFSALLTGWAIYQRMILDQTVPGWASTVVPIYFLGGLQILSLGIIGEYVAKIYLESKRRPLFHIEELLGDCFAPSPGMRAGQ